MSLAIATGSCCGHAFALDQGGAKAALQVRVTVLSTCAIDTRASVGDEQLERSVGVACRGTAEVIAQVSAPTTLVVDGQAHSYSVATLNF